MLKRRKRRGELPTFDMTPVIDCVFQLLIFFIVCTRFKETERVFRPDLSTTEGPSRDSSVPKEQLTVYCQWDDDTQSGQYVVAIGARGRLAVQGTHVKLADLFPLDRDTAAEVQRKHDIYKAIHTALKDAIVSYAKRSGAPIEKIEISFAKDATVGARSGTAPWAFVSLAIDAANSVNEEREKKLKLPKYELTFKFADAFRRMPR